MLHHEKSFYFRRVNYCPKRKKRIRKISLAFTSSGSGGANSSSSANLSTSTWNSPAGDTVVVTIAMFGQTVNVVKDSNNKVFTVIGPVNTAGGGHLYTCYAFAVAGGATYSVNVTTTGGPNEVSIAAEGFTPPAGTTVSLDQQNTATNSGSATPSLSVAGVAVGALVIGSLTKDSNGTLTAGSGYTLTTNGQQPASGDATSHQPIVMERNLNGAGGTTIVAFGTTVTAWALRGVSFKATPVQAKQVSAVMLDF